MRCPNINQPMIKFLAMDVDGTLTDGKVYMGKDGESFKAFDIKDGFGIKEMLPKYNIIPIVITARKSEILVNRCNELGIVEIHQGIEKKLDCLKNILNQYSSKDITYTLKDVAYIGDDVLDLQCLKPVKNTGGVTGCPNDAVSEVKSTCSFIASNNGGQGAVREFIEYLIAYGPNHIYYDIELKSRIDYVTNYISKLNFLNLIPGIYEVNEGFLFKVIEYATLDENESSYESHRKHIDIQWIISGKEKLFLTDISHLEPKEEYDEVNDIIRYKFDNNMSSVILQEGNYAIIFPKDAHKIGRISDEKILVKKIVGKLKL